MTPPVARDTAGGRAYNDLRNLAKRHGRDPAEYLTLFALEGFLTRLAGSPQSGDFLLKGGVLMAAFAARRPTRDIDLLAADGFPNDVADVVDRVRSIVRHPVDDGLEFDAETLSGEEIRDDAVYAGVRVHVVARLASARVALHVDVNFGDPVWPEPVDTEFPLLLGGSIVLRGYPASMVLAEKIITALERGEANTRWRDFVDVAAIAGTRAVEARELRTSLETVAAYRQVELGPMADPLRSMPALAQPKWSAWRRKQRLTDSTPEQFRELLAECCALADPVLTSVFDGVWEGKERRWSVG